MSDATRGCPEPYYKKDESGYGEFSTQVVRPLRSQPSLSIYLKPSNRSPRRQFLGAKLKQDRLGVALVSQRLPREERSPTVEIDLSTPHYPVDFTKL